MKRTLTCLILSLLVTLPLCACMPAVPSPAAPVQTPAAQTDAPSTEAAIYTEAAPGGDALPQGVAEALRLGQPAMLWQIDPEASLDGTGTTWSYAPLDCRTLWPELQAALFPDAEESSAETEAGQTRIVLTRGDTEIRVEVSANWLSLEGLGQDDAPALAEQLAAWLTDPSGFTLQQVPPDSDEGESLCYAFFAQGVKVDTQPFDLTMGSALRVLDGAITLEYPLRLGAALQTDDLASAFSMEEAKLLASLQLQANPFPWVCVLEDYEPILAIDAENGRLVPAWRFIGRFWELGDSGFRHGMDFTVNALTGQVIRFG